APTTPALPSDPIIGHPQNPRLMTDSPDAGTVGGEGRNAVTLDRCAQDAGVAPEPHGWRKSDIVGRAVNARVEPYRKRAKLDRAGLLGSFGKKADRARALRGE